MDDDLFDKLTKPQKRHPKCKGYRYWTAYGFEYDCGYDGNTLTCEECKYGVGRKDPQAKCNTHSK